MAKFYQPQSTQGIYDAAHNRLTVNQFDDVRIGFQAASRQEYERINVDTSERVDLGRASMTATSYEINIDTSKPVRFSVTATEDVAMSALPRNVVKPLEVVVRPPSYPGKPCVGQEHDPAGCWAACLAYWLTVADGRSPRRFIDIVGDFNGVWNQMGFISVSALQTQIAHQSKRYNMATDVIKPQQLDHYVGRWPLLIGFKHPAGFGHMNVLTAYDSDADLARAMDPWSPNPPPNSIDLGAVPFVFNGNEGDFQFRGIFIYRALRYVASPMPSGNILVGYPREYLKRMP